MADQKSAYSEASKHYIDVRVPKSSIDQERFERAKFREAKYKENWKKQSVNINEVIDQFCSNFTVKEKGEKFIFKGERYDVSADMVGGYLRIYDNSVKKWILLDGSIASPGKGHYKIKRREDM